MSERQCPECGGELGLAVRPARHQDANGGLVAATSLSTLWRCSTCGRAFTAEQVREGKRQRSKALRQAWRFISWQRPWAPVGAK